MVTLKVEQLLHGYRRGHEQLASSVKLPPRDTELITRLSDLSGSLSSFPKISTYLTVYPLPNQEHFAVSRTWPDHEASRAGCVLTHTLLVPISAWSTMREPILLDGLFMQPSSARETRKHMEPLALSDTSTTTSLSPVTIDETILLGFVHRYFGEGKRPLVWFTQKEAERILWHLLRGLWPRLRANFSACTLCLQPRSLEDRQFDLMFAPSVVHPRFRNIQYASVIETHASSTSTDEMNQIEPWCREWLHRLFRPVSRWIPPARTDLWTELDEDPTAIRRIILLEQLMRNRESTPHVFVGAMDLINSIAKAPKAALTSKRQVTERAIQAATEADEPEVSLECLSLISDRLERDSFAYIEGHTSVLLRQSVSTLIQKYPERTVILSLFNSLKTLTESPFGLGFIDGIRHLSHGDPGKLMLMQGSPVAARHIIIADPQLGALLVRVVAAERNKLEVRRTLLGWITSVEKP